MDPTSLPPALETVILNIRHSITRLRMGVIRNLYVDLSEITDTEDKVTDDVFESTLGEHGIFLSQSQMWQITRYFGDGEDNLNWRDIMDHIVGKIHSAKKNKFFKQLFDYIKQQDSDTITIPQILDKFDATRHPKVMVGFLTPDKAYQEFVYAFNGLPQTLNFEIFTRTFQEMAIYFFDEEYLEVFFSAILNIPHSTPQEEISYKLADTKRVVKEKLRNRQKGNESFEQTLVRLFKFFDINGDEHINLDEFKTTFSRMGLFLSEESVQALFRVLDGDHDNNVNYKEFTKNFLGDQ